MFNIVLHEPEKPENTGNIGRTCVITGSNLHLIYPIGFNLTKKSIQRAGLDYWDRLNLFKYANFAEFSEYFHNNFSSNNMWFATTKGKICYTDVQFNEGDFIVFGKESAGIPEEILSKDMTHCIRIPMLSDERSLNLSNSVAIVLYEALRQNKFKNMEKCGNLHRLKYL